MKRIVETLLEAEIDESMIHRILDLIEEEYEIVDEGENLFQIARKHGASRELKKKAYEQPSDYDDYGEYDVERGPMSIQMAPKSRGNYDTKNIRGKVKTDVRHDAYSDSPYRGAIIDLHRERDKENGYPNAINKSINRNKQKLQKKDK